MSQTTFLPLEHVEKDASAAKVRHLLHGGGHGRMRVLCPCGHGSTGSAHTVTEGERGAAFLLGLAKKGPSVATVGPEVNDGGSCAARCLPSARRSAANRDCDILRFLPGGKVRRTAFPSPLNWRPLSHFLLLGGVEGGVVEQVEDGLAVGEGKGEELA